MTIDPSGHRRSHTIQLSIPLQDLAQPDHNDEPRAHRRTLSERGRRLFARPHSTRNFGRYEQLLVPDSPTESPQPVSPIRIPVEALEVVNEPDEFSPLADRGALQEALGFEGFASDRATSYERQDGSERLYGEGPSRRFDSPNGSVTSLADTDYDGSSNVFPSIGEDTAHLTNPLFLQPMATSAPHTPRQDSQKRVSFYSSHLSPSVNVSVSPRLGDDLAAAEAGMSCPGRRRGLSGVSAYSLSPSSAASPFHRASTIMREMSQRVVNISNEPEPVQQDMPRRPSYSHSPTPSARRPSKAVDSNEEESQSPIEKLPSPVEEVLNPVEWKIHANPLRGKSLGLFTPHSRVRTFLCDVLVHSATEQIVLGLIIVQTILLAVESAPSVYNTPRELRFGLTWFDWALFGIFVFYTIEVIMRIIVSGFVVNPIEYSTINRGIGLRQALTVRFNSLFTVHSQLEPSIKSTDTANHSQDQGHEQPSLLRSLTGSPAYKTFPKDVRNQKRLRLAHRAFLRHSFNRVDFLAVISYWISFVLAVTGTEDAKYIYVFRMLGCLRILRLLSLTSGTSIILRSLKKAAPLLLNVALLIGFFWLLFAVIGVQSFKTSLRRTCVWLDPSGTPNDLHNPNNYFSNQPGGFQFCGGSTNSSGHALPYLNPDGSSSGIHKGYLCPPGSVCVAGANPYGNTVSFDNIFQSLELVFVVMSSNTYTDLMYYLMDTDHLIAALFFAAGIIVFALWLVNLLIAVITSSFQIIREESQNSAFAAEKGNLPNILPSSIETRKSSIKKWYDRTFWVWIAVIIYGLVCQSLRTAHMSPTRALFISNSETSVTLILCLEIIFRLVADRRHFFKQKENWLDLMLAVTTAVIQIPPIHNSGQPYAWLTIFQILRIYRVVLAVPWTADLIILVLGNTRGLLNLIIFLFLFTFLVAILASQLFRGLVPAQNSAGNQINVNFRSMFNSFLGMYQILSSENWTTILYNTTTAAVQWNTAWIGAIFLILWFILGFFIVLNMFIAVIQENFDVSEDEKRLQQVRAFLQRKELGTTSHGTLSLSSMFKFGAWNSRRQDPLDYGPAMMEMLLKEAVVKDFLDDDHVRDDIAATDVLNEPVRPISMMRPTGPFSSIRSLYWNQLMKYRDPNPFYTRLKLSKAQEDLAPRNMAAEVVKAAETRKRAQRDYLMRHPTYNVSLYIFKPNNWVRKMCQKVVGPGRGSERIEGSQPNPLLWYIFSAFLYLSIVAMVLLACITTPLYQRQYFSNKAFSVKNWFVYSDMAFAVVFTIEAAIRVIADGFYFTPNAYFRSSWGLIDGVVLVTLWINVAASLYNEGAVSRAVGAFKALRALRLLNVSDSARETFHSVIVKGGWKVLSAAFVSISLLIPFAIYGLNLFNGRMESCNDNTSNIFNLQDCVLEYPSSPYQWNMLAPRQVANQYYSFDNFGSSLFILFQIVSQEGWIDVMWSAISITGVYTQPALDASQFNAVFFVVFNLLGSVFVLTLFVSVFMRNYTEQTGVAFLTTDQRAWLELRKRLRQVAPSKRPSPLKKRQTWQQWCYHRAIRKTGMWQRVMTLVLLFHLVLLCIEWGPADQTWAQIREYIFLGLTIFYAFNVVVRLIGLTWPRFRKSSWDMYSLVTVTGTIITAGLQLSDPQQRTYGVLQQLFLVSLVLLLIPRNNQLDQLFKTAAASLTAITNLAATWFVLFLVFAIALTQAFGLTRFGANETDNINFRTVPKALILLFRMSTGEGWNQIMEDFAGIQVPYCNIGRTFLDSDCGSNNWARALFIAWNILSMYIFVNMFLSLIYESFSYVYQRSSGLSAISRAEIRRFKEAWAQYDPEGTGFITKEDFPRLLRELSGIFDMRIYDGEFTLSRLKEACSVVRKRSTLPVEGTRVETEIDLAKLNAMLADLPVEQIRQRRLRLNIFYQEVLLSADLDRGIAFNQLLMILAHYKVTNDDKSLRLEEFLRRRARLQRIEEGVRRSTVSSFFDTVYWRGQLRKALHERRLARMDTIPQLQVPEIFIEDEDAMDTKSSTPTTRNRPSLALKIPSVNVFRQQDDAGESSPSTIRYRSDSMQVSPTAGSSSNQRQLSPQRPSFQSMRQYSSEGAVSTGSAPPSPMLEVFPAEGDSRGRSGSGSTVSAQDMRDVIDNSAWGESLRRSFTLKRRQS